MRPRPRSSRTLALPLAALVLVAACDGSDLPETIADTSRPGGDVTMPPVSDSGPTVTPAFVTVADFAGLRWIEGDWRGVGAPGTDQPPFFERYRFGDDSTLLVTTYEDSTFGQASDTARWELRGHRVLNAGDGMRWAATRLDSLGARFDPVARARNAFTWQRARVGRATGEWTAVITMPGEPDRTYRMTRLTRAR